MGFGPTLLLLLLLFVFVPKRLLIKSLLVAEGVVFGFGSSRPAKRSSASSDTFPLLFKINSIKYIEAWLEVQPGEQSTRLYIFVPN